MTNLTDTQKYCYCNYCKHFMIEDAIKFYDIPPIGVGYCSNKSTRLSGRLKFYHNSCDNFSYSIHNHYGFNDPDKIIEFAAASLPAFMFRNFDIKIEKERRKNQDNPLLMK